MNTDIIRRFRENLRHFERQLERQNSSGTCCGVSVAQCHLLMELNKEDGITLNTLSDRLVLDKSTVSRTVEGLVNTGMVTRIIPKENRRTTHIFLTEQGARVCTTINAGNDDYFINVLLAIPEKDREGFFNSFEKMVKKMVE